MTKYETVKANESGAMSNAREYAARRDFDMAAFWYHAAQGFRARAENMTIREAGKFEFEAELCSEERSMISPDYAQNLIRDFIIRKNKYFEVTFIY